MESENRVCEVLDEADEVVGELTLGAEHHGKHTGETGDDVQRSIGIETEYDNLQSKHTEQEQPLPDAVAVPKGVTKPGFQAAHMESLLLFE